MNLEKNYGLYIAGVVVMVNIVGASYNFGIFSYYNYSFFLYANLEDLFISAFRIPIVMFYVAIMFSLVYFTSTRMGRIVREFKKDQENSFSVAEADPDAAYWERKADLLEADVKRRVRARLVQVTVFSIVLVSIMPMGFGYMLAARGGAHDFSAHETVRLTDALLGFSTRVNLTCELFSDGKRVSKTITGRMISDAGDFYLVDEAGSGLLVAKSCVKTIEIHTPVPPKPVMPVSAPSPAQSPDASSSSTPADPANAPAVSPDAAGAGADGGS